MRASRAEAESAAWRKAEGSRVDENHLNTVRAQLLRMHYESKVGHLGGNLSALDAMLVLHHELMQPSDRFVLSKGHSAGAYYVTLWSLGQISESELETFHKDGTRLAGHPLARGLPAIEFATGSLGHGLSLAAGLALAARMKGQKHRIYCMTSDGEWQEGSTLEALIFATHHKLSNLTVLVDHNGLQGFGATSEVASMAPLDAKIAGFGVETRRCNGHDISALRETIGLAADRKPVVIILETQKGRGIPGFEGRMESHYLPPTQEQYEAGLAAFMNRA